MLNTRGNYPANWPAIAHQVKEQAGHCCIRCGHPHDTASGHMLTVHHFDGDKYQSVSLTRSEVENNLQALLSHEQFIH